MIQLPYPKSTHKDRAPWILGSSCRNVWGNSYTMFAKLDIKELFTSGEWKLCLDIKMFQNVISNIVEWIFDLKLWLWGSLFYHILNTQIKTNSRHHQFFPVPNCWSIRNLWKIALLLSNSYKLLLSIYPFKNALDAKFWSKRYRLIKEMKTIMTLYVAKSFLWMKDSWRTFTGFAQLHCLES